MAQTHASITDDLRAFIERQHAFFVASTPLAGEGHVNVSPKGLDCLRVLSPMRVAYVDLTGSGNETSAHLAENGRLTIMFCAFEGKPLILRLYGRGRVVLPGAAEWAALVSLFPPYPGIRQIVVSDVTRVQTSCGFAVPLMSFEGDRDLLTKWAAAKGDDKLVDYRRAKNVRSIDNLPTPLSAELGPVT
jgi:hypothetical protein